MKKLKKAWKAFGGAVVTGVGMYLLQAAGMVEVVDPTVKEAMTEGFAQIGTAAVASLATFVGVWLSPKNEE